MMNPVPAGVVGTMSRCAPRTQSSWSTAHRSFRSGRPMTDTRTDAVVDIVDTTMRDGNQSLWSATGLTTSDVVAISPTMDRVGFHAVDFTSSTHMAVAVRFIVRTPGSDSGSSALRCRQPR